MTRLLHLVLLRLLLAWREAQALPYQERGWRGGVRVARRSAGGEEGVRVARKKECDGEEECGWRGRSAGGEEERVAGRSAGVRGWGRSAGGEEEAGGEEGVQCSRVYCATTTTLVGPAEDLTVYPAPVFHPQPSSGPK
ncbi:hypothetical protein Hamer_G024039 [Homarus americanus]|uniref:Uncharacterized protein n=1 Tax=Homarus americanus TaxID=6706 RepID=A0A8J5NBT7_HOMAM|nr:hypothetical protein Hamer_G024039 [Homarus americanus]